MADNYQTANLSPQELNKIKSLEGELSSTVKKNIVLIAYEQGSMIAPGIDDQEELDQKATDEEIRKGNYTKVTTLSYDEVNPS